ncbi:MAG TPA: F0F1 ATP synthase subunit epsilon [Devosiaceae bacterium]|jgi:F-type H+-transporting ATPase subunit epsilon|nr:F0F1 ATP synthase subunit epsilon [Devosiaceae bacterium]
MAEGTKLEIVSPERLVMSEQVNSVTVPGTDGYFTVMGDHAPLMTTLKPGFVTAVAASGSSQFYVRGGFADISPAGLTILAEEAREAADFERSEIEALIAESQQQLDAAATPEEKATLQHELDAWRNLLIDASATTATH